MAQRIYRQFVYGFKPDWEDASPSLRAEQEPGGRRLRLGSNPEIVVLEFQ